MVRTSPRGSVRVRTPRRIGSGVRVSASFHMFALRKWRPSQFTYAVAWSGFRDRVNCGKLALTCIPDHNRHMRRVLALADPRVSLTSAIFLAYTRSNIRIICSAFCQFLLEILVPQTVTTRKFWLKLMYTCLRQKYVQLKPHEITLYLRRGINSFHQSQSSRVNIDRRQRRHHSLANRHSCST